MCVAKQLLRLSAIVHGHVQGVGYRMFAIESARNLEVAGWVRNRSDGTVEVSAEGTRQELEAFLETLRSGAHLGYVSRIDESWFDATGEYRQFWYLETLDVEE
jgi:acylphosphatase